MCGCQEFLGCEISFPSIYPRLQQGFLFFRPPELVNFRLKWTNLLLRWWRYTHTFNRFSRSGISTFCHWSQGLANETWNPKCESRHSPFLARNANGNPSTETSRPLARGRPLRDQTRLAPLAKRSTCSKSSPVRKVRFILGELFDTWSWQPNDRMWFWLDGCESCCVGVEDSSKSICVRRFSPSALPLFRFHLSPFPPRNAWYSGYFQTIFPSVATLKSPVQHSVRRYMRETSSIVICFFKSSQKIYYYYYYYYNSILIIMNYLNSSKIKSHGKNSLLLLFLVPLVRPWRVQFRTRLNSDTPAFCTMNVLQVLVCV